jgi:hypothetical protein
LQKVVWTIGAEGVGWGDKDDKDEIYIFIICFD